MPRQTLRKIFVRKVFLQTYFGDCMDKTGFITSLFLPAEKLGKINMGWSC